MNDNSDREVITRIKNGEIDDFGILIKKYTVIIYAYVNKRVFNKHDVDDIVQNIFISFYRSIARFDEKKAVLPYLFEIARNELKMYYRAHKITLPLKDSLPAENISDNDWRHEIGDLIKVLPKDQQQALIMVSEGYSYQEIANQLKKPLNTVRTIIRRARLRIIKLSQYEKS